MKISRKSAAKAKDGADFFGPVPFNYTALCHEQALKKILYHASDIRMRLPANLIILAGEVALCGKAKLSVLAVCGAPRQGTEFARSHFNMLFKCFPEGYDLVVADRLGDFINGF